MALPVASVIGPSCLNSTLERTGDSASLKGCGDVSKRVTNAWELNAFDMEKSKSLDRLLAGPGAVG
jgi:hypothetical protein